MIFFFFSAHGQFVMVLNACLDVIPQNENKYFVSGRSRIKMFSGVRLRVKHLTFFVVLL